MDRINHSSAVTDKFGVGKDGWTNGDPSDPGSGTVPQSDFLDGLQEETVGIIEAAGLTPTNADYTQLVQALLLKIGGTMTGTIAFNIADDETPRLSEVGLVSGNNRRLIFHSGYVRVYTDFTDLAVAYNCSYDNATDLWSQDAGPGDAGVIQVDPASQGLRVFSGAITAGVFADDANLDLTRLVDPSPQRNTMYAVGVSKIIGRINSNAGAPFLIGDQLGIASVAEVAGGIVVTFDNAFDSNAYFPAATILGSSAQYGITVDAVSPISCNVWIADAAGVAVDLGVESLSFTIDIKGTHA